MTIPLPEGLARIHDISVQLTVVLGTARMPLRDVLALGEDSVVLLDRLVDEPVTLLVNGTPVARGEVVADRNRFGVRVLELMGDGHAAAAPANRADGG